MRYARNPAVNETEVEGEFFLVEPEGGDIYYLDALTSGLWRLLETPRDAVALTATLQEAFPETAPDQVTQDLQRVLADLLDHKLILTVE